jgi:hypothetical protein
MTHSLGSLPRRNRFDLQRCRNAERFTPSTDVLDVAAWCEMAYNLRMPVALQDAAPARHQSKP